MAFSQIDAFRLFARDFFLADAAKTASLINLSESPRTPGAAFATRKKFFLYFFTAIGPKVEKRLRFEFCVELSEGFDAFNGANAAKIDGKRRSSG